MVLKLSQTDGKYSQWQRNAYIDKYIIDIDISYIAIRCEYFALAWESLYINPREEGNKEGRELAPGLDDRRQSIAKFISCEASSP